jgi:hypothetical protein
MNREQYRYWYDELSTLVREVPMDTILLKVRTELDDAEVSSLVGYLKSSVKSLQESKEDLDDRKAVGFLDLINALSRR